ncbi:hypothetical protein SAMN02982927_03377 [Sporolactobacillus nakayamae]|uniref:Uncharacterized protein n=1 Tax=Sporolactobacillus nakayamae TaxID=269670 RepID=A0A1I2W2X5_9BACL|nr:hypothetical protein SAMN02982927_03377 [Sporolactobacillus nakayamae]
MFSGLKELMFMIRITRVGLNFYRDHNFFRQKVQENNWGTRHEQPKGYGQISKNL